MSYNKWEQQPLDTPFQAATAMAMTPTADPLTIQEQPPQLTQPSFFRAPVRTIQSGGSQQEQQQQRRPITLFNPPSGQAPSQPVSAPAAAAIPTRDLTMEYARSLASLGGKKNSARFVVVGSAWVASMRIDEFPTYYYACGTFKFDLVENTRVYENIIVKKQREFAQTVQLDADRSKPYQTKLKNYTETQAAITRMNQVYGRTAASIGMTWGTYFQVEMVVKAFRAFYPLVDVAVPDNQASLYYHSFYAVRPWADILRILEIRWNCVVTATALIRDYNWTATKMMPVDFSKSELGIKYPTLSDDARKIPLPDLDRTLKAMVDKDPIGVVALSVMAAFPMDVVQARKASEYRIAKAKRNADWQRMDADIKGHIEAVCNLAQVQSKPVREFVKEDAGMIQYREAMRRVKLYIRTLKLSLGGGRQGGSNTNVAPISEPRQVTFVPFGALPSS